MALGNLSSVWVYFCGSNCGQAYYCVVPMGEKLILYAVLLALSGFFKSVMDALVHFYGSSVFGKFDNSFWNPGWSWKRKWKKAPGGKILQKNHKSLWYYLWMYKPRYKERFPYSSTALVWMTDGWHLAQTLYLTSWQIIVAMEVNITNWFFDLILVKLIHNIVFETFYTKWKTK